MLYLPLLGTIPFINKLLQPHSLQVVQRFDPKYAVADGAINRAGQERGPFKAGQLRQWLA